MKFYDTNALLELQDEVLNEEFYISSVTLEELEDIKSQSRKDPAVKYAARKVVHMLEGNEDKYKVVFYDKELRDFLEALGKEETPDNKICACAQIVDAIFVTGDICCKLIAQNFFHLNVVGVGDRTMEDYKGYLEVKMSDESIADLYTYPKENVLNMLTNQYLIVRNLEGELVDKFRWTGEIMAPVKVKALKSSYFGEVKPYNGDVYQQLVIDSFLNNQITMVRGPAGAGKTLLQMGFMFSLLEKHKIDKIVIFCNTPKTANSVGLGLTDRAPSLGNWRVQIS